MPITDGNLDRDGLGGKTLIVITAYCWTLRGHIGPNGGYPSPHSKDSKRRERLKPGYSGEREKPRAT